MSVFVNWYSSMLPEEAIVNIFLFLKLREIRSFSCLNHRNYELSKRALMWKELSERKWGKNCEHNFHERTLPLPRLSTDEMDWKAFFLYRIATPRRWKSIRTPKLQLWSRGQPNKGFKIAHFDDWLHVTVDREGRIIVSECEKHRIQVFSPDGQFLHVFGKEGKKPGQLRNPSGITVDDENHILVADKYNNRIGVYDINGNSLRSFGSKGTGDGQLSSPFGITVDRKYYRVIVTERGSDRISVFNDNGEWLFCFGSGGNQMVSSQIL